ncbi:MAG: response regulator [Proteobacteria bacterium]|nr:response regulator [Pseudomonadota bacterium]
MTARTRRIRRSLIGMLLLTTGIVVVLTTAAFSVYEVVTTRELASRDLATLAKLIAANSTAALAFDNPGDARRVLATVRTERHVSAAALYSRDGTLFATYPATVGKSLPARAPAVGERFAPSQLVVVQGVFQGNLRLGTLYLKSDLGVIYERIRLYALIAGIILALAGASAYLIASRLQREISDPILALAETATAVSQKGDYSVRAPPAPGHELGLLTGAFNHMLTRIEEAQSRLHIQLARLDLLHRITRAIGDRLDLSSIFQVVVGTLEADLPIDFGCICTHEPGAQFIRLQSIGARSLALAGALGLSQGEPIPIDPNGLSRCIGGELVYEPDTSSLPFPFPKRFAGAGIHSLVIAPMIVEQSVFSILVAGRCASEAFSSADCEFLDHLCGHVALAARQAQLHGALRQAYDDLRRSQQAVMQQERLRALGQMASGIAHDINNAISPVALYTESLLEREPNLSDRARGYLGTIQRAIEDVADTVARMREFYRPREPQLVLARVALNRTVEHVVDLTRARWSDVPQQRGIVIQLHKELSPDLPQIMGAEGEIRDALTNLIFNAVDAMPQGGTLTVRTRASFIPDGSCGAVGAGEAERRVTVEVADSGIGMDEETRRRCLEPFYTTKGERGTGLGLAMVYGMVQRHSAELEIDSKPGCGATVRLSFPVTSEAPQVSAPSMRAQPERRLSILLVDDDPLLIKSLRDILEGDGHRVTAADGGQHGIDEFTAAQKREMPFEVVITDLGMPYVDGRRVAAAVRAASPTTPIILLTGWGRRLLAENDIPPHVDRVLGKPPKLMELRAALADLTGSRAA